MSFLKKKSAYKSVLDKYPNLRDRIQGTRLGSYNTLAKLVDVVGGGLKECSKFHYGAWVTPEDRVVLNFNTNEVTCNQNIPIESQKANIARVFVNYLTSGVTEQKHLTPDTDSKCLRDVKWLLEDDSNILYLEILIPFHIISQELNGVKLDFRLLKFLTYQLDVTVRSFIIALRYYGLYESYMDELWTESDVLTEDSRVFRDYLKIWQHMPESFWFPRFLSRLVRSNSQTYSKVLSRMEALSVSDKKDGDVLVNWGYLPCFRYEISRGFCFGAGLYILRF